MRTYQFAVLRYRHSASSGEFVNIGLALWVPSDRRLLYDINQKSSRLSHFFSDFRAPAYKRLVRDMEARFRDIAERCQVREPTPGFSAVLEELVVGDASCFQWSPVMAGVAADPEQRLGQLRLQFVYRHAGTGPRERKSEMEIWSPIARGLREAGIWDRLQHDVLLRGQHYEHKFKSAWRNGELQVLEPISFDYLSKTEVIDKANTWAGRLHSLGGNQFELTGVVARPERPDLVEPYQDAIDILRSAPRVRHVYEMHEVEAVVRQIQGDFALHA